MPDVARGGYSVDALWLRSLSPKDQWRFLRPDRAAPSEDHLTGVRAGPLRMRCTTCGLICLPLHRPMTLTDNETGEERTIPGAWVGPDGDPIGHFYPFAAPEPENAPVERPESPANGRSGPGARPAGIPAGAPRRSKHTPSRSPAARHVEYLKAKRRAKR